MFRHWLDTLAQEGAISQHEIARWMGRRRVKNNAAYDHVSGFKMAENARELFRKGEVIGGLKELYDGLPATDREAFLASQIQTAHTTAYGMCMNDWSLLPCAKHGKCGAACAPWSRPSDTPHQVRAAETWPKPRAYRGPSDRQQETTWSDRFASGETPVPAVADSCRWQVAHSYTRGRVFSRHA